MSAAMSFTAGRNVGSTNTTSRIQKLREDLLCTSSFSSGVSVHAAGVSGVSCGVPYTGRRSISLEKQHEQDVVQFLRVLCEFRYCIFLNLMHHTSVDHHYLVLLLRVASIWAIFISPQTSTAL